MNDVDGLLETTRNEINTIEPIHGLAMLPNGVANLISQLTRAMKTNKASPIDILTVQRTVCEQFGIYLPECFEKSKEEPIVYYGKNPLDDEIDKIISGGGNKKWLKVRQIKLEYPALSQYGEAQIGSALSKRGIPRRNSKGYKKYLLPVNEIGGDNSEQG